MKKQINVSLKCPFCGKSLMDEEHKINDQTSIKIVVESEKDKGFLWLCSVYGCFDHEANVEIKDSEIVKLSCPHCNNSLIRKILCEKCGAPIAGMSLNVGGKVNFCSRKGCTNHYVVFEDIGDALNLFYEEFKYLQ